MGKSGYRVRVQKRIMYTVYNVKMYLFSRLLKNLKHCRILTLYRALLDEQKINFRNLVDQLGQLSEKFGTKIISSNEISIAIGLSQGSDRISSVSFFGRFDFIKK